jgi:hypothetical protein
LSVLSLAALASACANKTSVGKCTPKSASGFTALSLDSGTLGGTLGAPVFNVTTATSLSNAKSPRMPGGLLRIETLAAGTNAPESVTRDAFSRLVFSKQRDCSASFEFRKVGEDYFVDSFLSHSCIYPKLIYRGRNPVVQVFRPAADGLLDGFEAIAVSMPEIEARNEALVAFDAIPQAQFDQRSLLVEYGFGTEKIVELRRVALEKETSGLEPGLGAALCLAVPQAEIDAYLDAPEDSQGDDPALSTTVRPSDCQILASSQWFEFKVPPAEVASKKALLDALVAETAAYKAFVKERSGLTSVTMAKLDDLRAKSAQWYAAERRYRTLRLGMFGVRAANNGCPSDDAWVASANKTFAGESRAAFVDVIKKIVPADAVADIEALKAHACGNAEPAFTAYANKLADAASDADDKAFELAKVYRDIQLAMKAQKDRVGIATNHIWNYSADSVVVTYKDLAAFPPTGGLATELLRHSFSFEKDWVSMSFDATKAHPLVNNLRSELNDGYAITFGGVPVGAVLAKIDESGGASVIALPKRGRAGEGKTEGAAAQAPASNSNKRETTTTSSPDGGGC